MSEKQSREIPWQDPRWGWNPLLGLESLKISMNQLFNELFSRGEGSLAAFPWQPPIDLYEMGDDLLLEISLPGVNKDEVELHATSDLVVIKGKAPEKKEIPAQNFFSRERKGGEFFRTIPLPYEIRPDAISAGMENGVLTIRLVIATRKVRRKGYRVEIQ